MQLLIGYCLSVFPGVMLSFRYIVTCILKSEDDELLKYLVSFHFDKFQSMKGHRSIEFKLYLDTTSQCNSKIALFSVLEAYAIGLFCPMDPWDRIAPIAKLFASGVTLNSFEKLE